MKTHCNFLASSITFFIIFLFSSIPLFSACLKTEDPNTNLFLELHAESLPLNNNVKEKDKELKIAFTPPPGWHFAETTSLPANVKTLVVGQGRYEFPPSINLGLEVYPGTLKQYLKRVKEINRSQGYTWKDMGKIKTQLGEASLSQVDTQTKWGEVKLMHVIFQENGIIYILTAAALKDEFPKFYKDFFNSMCSLRFENA